MCFLLSVMFSLSSVLLLEHAGFSSTKYEFVLICITGVLVAILSSIWPIAARAVVRKHWWSERPNSILWRWIWQEQNTACIWDGAWWRHSEGYWCLSITTGMSCVWSWESREDLCQWWSDGYWWVSVGCCCVKAVWKLWLTVCIEQQTLRWSLVNCIYDVY